MMIRRNDPQTGRFRWSIPSRKRCFCTKVAIRLSNINDCPQDEIDPKELWFTDHTDELTNRDNWSEEIMDQLFDRKITCGNSTFHTYLLSFNGGAN